jgi:hypothetical protein
MGVRRLGQSSDCPAHTAGLLVHLGSEPSVLAPLPQLDKGGRQQWKSTCLVVDVFDESFRQTGLNPETRPACWELDRPAELVLRHRTEQHVVLTEQGCECWIARAMPVEVRA